MRPTYPILVVMRALLFALMGVVFAAGTASAHGQAASATLRTYVADQFQKAQAKNIEAMRDMAEQVDYPALSTSGQRSDGNQPCAHLDDCCCNLGCHTALAAPPTAPVRTRAAPSPYVTDLPDLLAGRPGDRAEKPPKRS